MEPNETNPETEMKPLVFRPITEGLGFHNPVEAEAPSPQVKQAALRAKSAYQAMPQKPHPIIGAKPVPAPSAPQSTAPVAPTPAPVVAPTKQFKVPAVNLPPPQSAPLISKPASPAQLAMDAAAKAAASKAKAESKVVPPKPVTVLSRSCAYLIDLGVHLLVGAVIMSVLLFRADLSISLIHQPWALGILVVALYSMHALLLTLQEIVFQTSLGKAIMGLQIPGNPFILFLRAIVFHLSFFFFGVGPLYALFRKDKRSLHDVITDTAVL